MQRFILTLFRFFGLAMTFFWRGNGSKSTTGDPALAILGRGALSQSVIFIVILVVSLFSVLALSGYDLLNRVSTSWRYEVSSQASLHISALSDAERDLNRRKALQLFNNRPGILSVRVLNESEVKDLLSPWIEEGSLAEEKLWPDVIILTIDQENPPDIPKLRQDIENGVSGAYLELYENWQTTIAKRVTSLISLVVMGVIFLLMGGILIVCLLTRLVIRQSDDLIDVLTSVGASEVFIANQFQMALSLTALKASLLGSLLAGLIFWLSLYFLDPGATLGSYLTDGLTFTDRLWLVIRPLFLVVTGLLLVMIVTTRLTIYQKMG